MPAGRGQAQASKARTLTVDPAVSPETENLGFKSARDVLKAHILMCRLCGVLRKASEARPLPADF